MKWDTQRVESSHLKLCISVLGLQQQGITHGVA